MSNDTKWVSKEDVKRYAAQYPESKPKGFSKHSHLWFDDKYYVYEFPHFSYASAETPTHTFGEDWNLVPIAKVDDVVVEPMEEKTGAVVSTGGSSSYYQLQITRKKDGEVFECEAGDLIYSLFGNDFDFGNIQKALIRIYQAAQGRGKVGTSIAYDIEKIKYFLEEIKKVNNGLR